MKITLKRSPAQGTASEAVTIAAKPSPATPAEPGGEAVESAAAAADAAAISSPDVSMDAGVMALPQSKSQRTTAVVFASLGIVAVLIFAALIGLQVGEFTFFGASDSLWLK